MDFKIPIFTQGVHNILDSEKIPADAIQDEKNWLSKDGVLRLVNGKYLVGTEGAAGKIQGLHIGYQRDGTKILFRKINTKLQYWNTTTDLWTDITNDAGVALTLTNDKECSFANYSSLAGDFVYISGYDGFWKIHTANPGNATNIYDATQNDKGKILIDKNRLIMWDCENASKTALKMSWIDAQDAGVYHDVAGEAVGALGADHYTGTVASRAGTPTSTCFALEFKGDVAAGTETFTDNGDGTLTSNYGGTGTINYTTGAYDITFSAVTIGAVTVDYTWESVITEGLADFTYTAVRVAGEGNLISQTIGGDRIMSVQVGQDGAYYSLKESSAYRLDISADDATFTNLVYRNDMGLPYWRAAVSTMKGIVFMDTSKPEKPNLTILTKNNVSGEVEPVILFPHFDFSKYSYDDCAIDTYDKYFVISCQSSESDFNDTILLCDLESKTVDISFYPARMFAKHTGDLYIGSPINQTVYKVFNGFDDDGFVIENFAILRAELMGTDNIKKYRKLKIQGAIEPDQDVEIWASYDDDDFELIDTIDGRAGYVDAGTPRTVGSNMVGTVPIGGDNATTIYPFFYEKKITPPKFRKMELKFIATNFGYIEITSVLYEDILSFSHRIPKKYKVKKT